MEMQFLIDVIKQSPVMLKGGYPYFYPYFIFSLTDGALPIKPKMLYRTAQLICNMIIDDDIYKIDYIIAPEAMAIPIATMVSYLVNNTPFVVARKRKYELTGEIEVHQITGYSESLMYINSIKPGHRVIIIDDVVSTGGTLKAIIDALRLNNITVLGSYTIIEKDGAAKKLREQGYDVRSLVNVIMGKDNINNVVESE